MKKRERIPINLFVENGESKANIKDDHRVTSTKNIIELLDGLSKSKAIVKSKKIKKENFVEYVYDVNEEENYSIVVRINNDERDKHFETIKYLDSLSDLSISLKKVNRARFVAGLALGALVLVIAGPSIGKSIRKNNDTNKPIKKQYEEILEDTDDYQRYYPSEEEKKEAEEYYYESLKKRAENGDEKAKAEYEDYYYEQIILEQMETEEENYKTY